MEFITPEEGWRARVASLGVRRTEVQVLAGVIAALVVLSLVAWSRGPGAAIAPPATVPPVLPSAAPTSSIGVAPVSGEAIFVHVAGAVRHPGLYEMALGSRVMDAIEAAGGAKPSARLDAINLAEVLQDAMKIEVPGRGGDPMPAAGPSPSSGAPAIVNLNTADQVALETIPGIGPVTATAILSYRNEIGSFESVDQLLDVDGIGPATLESLIPYVTV
jgi:competence protein ComEA